MNYVLILSVVCLCWAGRAYGQSLEQAVGQFNEVAGMMGAGSADGGVFSGFSLWSIVGGLIFSTIGLFAFGYGRKHSEWAPMAIGITLMVYPYFIRGTFAVYAVGGSLVAAWYVLSRL